MFNSWALDLLKASNEDEIMKQLRRDHCTSAEQTITECLLTAEADDILQILYSDFPRQVFMPVADGDFLAQDLSVHSQELSHRCVFVY